MRLPSFIDTSNFVAFHIAPFLHRKERLYQQNLTFFLPWETLRQDKRSCFAIDECPCKAFLCKDTLYDPWHYLGILERKPGGLRNGAPFKEWELPHNIRQLQKRILSKNGGDREFVEVLIAARSYGLEITEEACRQALSDRTVRSEVVLNLVTRQLDPPAIIDPVSTPEKLCLSEEPVADCARYDTLRQDVSCEA